MDLSNFNQLLLDDMWLSEEVRYRKRKHKRSGRRKGLVPPPAAVEAVLKRFIFPRSILTRDLFLILRRRLQETFLAGAVGKKFSIKSTWRKKEI